MSTQHFVLILLSVIILGTAIGVGITLIQNNQVREYELIALANGDNLSGTMTGIIFAISGSVGTEQIYKCMIKYKDGAKMVTLNAHRTIVYEIDSGTPRVVGRYITDRDNFSQFTRSEIYIPKGSILNKFEIDVSK